MTNEKKKSLGGKGLFAVLFWKVAAQYKRVMLETGKIQAAKAYVHAIAGLRQSALIIVGALLGVGFLMTGIIFLHAAVILASGWTKEQIAIFLLTCGVVYLAAAAGVLFYFLSGKLWARKFKVDEVVDKAMHD